MRNIGKEITMEMLSKLNGSKKDALIKALERNNSLTSTYGLSSCDMVIYKEGWYITLTGTRCSFSLFAYDRDGEIEIANRKPNESKLNKIYDTWFSMDESDFRGLNF